MEGQDKHISHLTDEGKININVFNSELITEKDKKEIRCHLT